MQNNAHSIFPLLRLALVPWALACTPEAPMAAATVSPPRVLAVPPERLATTTLHALLLSEEPVATTADGRTVAVTLSAPPAGEVAVLGADDVLATRSDQILVDRQPLLLRREGDALVLESLADPSQIVRAERCLSGPDLPAGAVGVDGGFCVEAGTHRTRWSAAPLLPAAGVLRSLRPNADGWSALAMYRPGETGARWRRVVQTGASSLVASALTLRGELALGALVDPQGQGALVAWDAENGAERWRVPLPAPVRQWRAREGVILLHPDGARVALVLDGAPPQLWEVDLADGHTRRTVALDEALLPTEGDMGLVGETLWTWQYRPARHGDMSRSDEGCTYAAWDLSRGRLIDAWSRVYGRWWRGADRDTITDAEAAALGLSCKVRRVLPVYAPGGALVIEAESAARLRVRTSDGRLPDQGPP